MVIIQEEWTSLILIIFSNHQETTINLATMIVADSLIHRQTIAPMTILEPNAMSSTIVTITGVRIMMIGGHRIKAEAPTALSTMNLMDARLQTVIETKVRIVDHLTTRQTTIDPVIHDIPTMDNMQDVFKLYDADRLL